MIEKINDSNINNQEKSKLKDILVYNGKEDEKLEKLIDINKTILKFLDDKNKDVYNKLKNKINKNEDKYMLNSNYIYKTFKIINYNYLLVLSFLIQKLIIYTTIKIISYFLWEKII